MKRFLCALVSAMLIAGLAVSAFPVNASVAEKEINLNSGAQRGGEYISINEIYESPEGTKQLIMTGLKNENKPLMINALKEHFLTGEGESLKIIDDALPDADKWDTREEDPFNSYDYNLCWAAAASDMLWISGWAEKLNNPTTGMPFGSEDELFTYYSDSFTDKSGQIDRAIDWFFMGEFFMSGVGSHAKPVTDGQSDGLMKQFVSSLVQTKYDLTQNPSQIAELERLDKASDSPAVFQASLGSLDDGKLAKSGHSVAVAGIVMNPSVDDFSERYQAIALIDGDNDSTPSAQAALIENPTSAQKLADKEARPNSFTLYPLRYTADADGKPFWKVVGYNDEELTVLYSVNALPLQSDALVAQFTETEGNRSVFNTVDLTIDTAFTTTNDMAYTDIFFYEMNKGYCETFIFKNGEPINLNYFVSNRSEVPLDESYADGKKLEVDWQVTRNSDGTVVSGGTDEFGFEIFGGREVGQLIKLNEKDGALENWEAGEYTVTLKVNPRHTIKEAYYLNNTDLTVKFKVENEQPQTQPKTEPEEPSTAQSTTVQPSTEANTATTDAASASNTGTPDQASNNLSGNGAIGTGTAGFSVIAVVLLTSGCLLVFFYRRKRNE